MIALAAPASSSTTSTDQQQCIHSEPRVQQLAFAALCIACQGQLTGCNSSPPPLPSPVQKLALTHRKSRCPQFACGLITNSDAAVCLALPCCVLQSAHAVHLRSLPRPLPHLLLSLTCTLLLPGLSCTAIVSCSQ
jgi:hypothetical protein